MKKISADFLKGFLLVFRAALFLVLNPRYWQYIIVPVLINIVIYAVLAYVFIEYLFPFLSNFLPAAKNYYLNFLYSAIEFFFETGMIIVMIAFFVISFTSLSFITSIPFLDMLSIRLEKEKYGFIFDAGGAGQFARDIWMTSLNGLRLALWSLLWTVVLYPVGFFIPYAGFLLPAVVLGYLFGISFLIYSVEHRRIRFSEFKKTLPGHRMLVLGFGLTMYVLFFIPFLPVLFLPVAVTGGTMIYNERIAAFPEKD
jgi:CysZ protein